MNTWHTEGNIFGMALLKKLAIGKTATGRYPEVAHNMNKDLMASGADPVIVGHERISMNASSYDMKSYKMDPDNYCSGCVCTT